jgi:ribonuclease E
MTEANPEELGVTEASGDVASPGTPQTSETPGSPTRRRRSRGGRGRGGRGRSRSSAAQGEDAGAGVSTSANEDVPSELPEIDLDSQPGETERVPGTIEPDVTDSETVTAPRRRRRRGGRGRGRTTAASDPAVGAETADDGDTAESVDAVEPKSLEVAGDATDVEGGLEVEVDGSTDGAAAPRRRRRRGGRGRRRRTATTASADADAGAVATESVTSGDDATDVDTAAPERTSRSRRSRSTTTKDEAARTRSARSRRSTTQTRDAEPAADRAGKTTPARGAEDGRASTRLSRQRQSRQVRRRRDVAPAVAPVTDKVMVVTEHGDRDQIAVLEERDLVQHYVTRAGTRSMVGNVYLGRVQNVLPGMEAAFVDVGRGRNAVLYAGEVNWSPEDLDGAPPRIEHVLKSGQSVLVQVTKDPIGGKGARLTAQISLPGRYLVLAPDSNVTGISRRLGLAERNRLKAIYRRIKPERHGLIVRTAAAGASEEALEADLQRLLDEWNSIEKAAKKAKAPAVLYEEPELTLRVARDLFTDEEYRELVTDSPRLFRLIVDYLRGIAPDLLAKVRLHEEKLPVFEEFHIVEQIYKGLDRKVWLPSGGYIVIDRTEALTVIDVNTGKSVGKTNLEETVVNTNVEAAREIARQLRLRDIGGMILIDFIDMLLEQNKRKVIDAMKDALAHDKSRSQVFDISPLGLLEVTRKRVSGGLLESFSETCPTCEGRGVILKYDVN